MTDIVILLLIPHRLLKGINKYSWDVLGYSDILKSEITLYIYTERETHTKRHVFCTKNIRYYLKFMPVKKSNTVCCTRIFKN